MPARRLFLAAAVCAAFAGRTASAQVQLTVGGGPVNFTAPTVTDYTNGFVLDATPLTYTVNIQADLNTQRTSIIEISSTSANLGGGKALADLQWRRSDLTAWNSLTTTPVTVESRSIRNGTLNDPWSNSVVFRLLLSWTADGPATHTANITVTMTVTTP